MLFAYANPICVALTVGMRSSFVGAPLAAGRPAKDVTVRMPTAHTASSPVLRFFIVIPSRAEDGTIFRCHESPAARADRGGNNGHLRLRRRHGLARLAGNADRVRPRAAAGQPPAGGAVRGGLARSRRGPAAAVVGAATRGRFSRAAMGPLLSRQ